MEEVITQAIELRKPVRFRYVKEGKNPGVRIGNPHALFVHPSTRNLQVEMYQTDGVSDSDLNEGLPWRKFLVEFFKDAEVLSEVPDFLVGEGYNPDSFLYYEAKMRI